MAINTKKKNNHFPLFGFQNFKSFDVRVPNFFCSFENIYIARFQTLLSGAKAPQSNLRSSAPANIIISQNFWNAILEIYFLFCWVITSVIRVCAFKFVIHSTSCTYAIVYWQFLRVLNNVDDILCYISNHTAVQKLRGSRKTLQEKSHLK